MRRRLRFVLASDRTRYLFAAAIGTLVVGFVAAGAAVARLLPIVLQPGVPVAAVRPLLAGAVALSIEVGALVGWPVGWVEVSLRSRERGEARARMALGERPARRLSRLWPSVLLLLAATGLGSFAWGRDAARPGRVARSLIAQARTRCLDAGAPRVATVPLLGAAWLCSPPHEPVLAGHGTGSASRIDFAGKGLDVSYDLSEIVLYDADLAFGTPLIGRFHVGEARVRGFSPWSTPSPVSAPWRAGVVAFAALLAALAATVPAMTGEVRVRAVAWAIALSGPATALVTLRTCERASVGDARLCVVPIAALGATLLARAVASAIGALVARRRASVSRRRAAT